MHTRPWVDAARVILMDAYSLDSATYYLANRNCLLWWANAHKTVHLGESDGGVSRCLFQERSILRGIGLHFCLAGVAVIFTNIERLHLLEQSVTMDAQDTSSVGLIPAGPFQCAQNILSFKGLTGLHQGAI